MESTMYCPAHFRQDDPEAIWALMKAHPFATFVSLGPDGLIASPLPTVVTRAPASGGPQNEIGVIEAHFARANPHWKALQTQSDVLVLFQGPHAYIRPGWYASKHADGKAVPTWNYAVVQAKGVAEIISDAEWLHANVDALSRQQEAGQPDPWQVAEAPENYIRAQLRGIVGVRVKITALEGKWKMSQNRTPPDQAGVVTGLRAQATPDTNAQIADTVAKGIPSE